MERNICFILWSGMRPTRKQIEEVCLQEYHWIHSGSTVGRQTTWGELKEVQSSAAPDLSPPTSSQFFVDLTSHVYPTVAGHLRFQSLPSHFHLHRTWRYHVGGPLGNGASLLQVCSLILEKESKCWRSGILSTTFPWNPRTVKHHPVIMFAKL